MKIKYEECLKKYSLMRIGGVADKLYVPENKGDLLELLDSLKEMNEKYYVVSGGSNILINDSKVFRHVISMETCNKEFSDLGAGRFYVGASVRLQSFILKINECGYGGIEYLFSVPGMIGGAIVMNAGRGKKYNQSIGDFVEAVEVIRDGKIECISKADCCFGYRESVFKKNEMTIIGVWFRFPEVHKEDSKKLREERIRLCRKRQDNGKPNLGSVLKKGNYAAFVFMKTIRMGYRNGVHFSGKCNNWIVNEGNGTFEQMIKIINWSGRIHRLLGCTQELEIIIWD